jgi:hypothetical protein
MMAGFSIIEEASTGLRFVARNPLIVATWAALQILINMGSTVLMITTAGPTLAKMTRLSQTKSDPQQVFALLGQVAPVYGLLLILSLAIYAVIYAAMSRAVLRPEDRRFAYLRLGMDEVRQGLLMLAYWFIGILVYLAVALVLMIILGIIAISLGSKSAGTAGMNLVVFIGVLLVAALFVFLAVRVSLASAMTFDQRRVDIFGSWALTRGRFWAIFATYLLCGVCAVVVGGVGMAVVLGVAKAANPAGSAIQAVFRGDMSTLGGYFTAGRVAYVLMWGVLSAVIGPLVLMPGPGIYRRLAAGRVGASGQSVAEVFS